MRWIAVLPVTVVLVLASNTVQANTFMAPHHATATPPSSLVIGEQYFDASVGGLRSYLESIKSSDPNLYMQLDPKLAQLERRHDSAVALLAAGIVVGVVSTVYAFAGRKSCNQGSDAWGQCTSDNVDHMATFAFLGIGAVIAGGLGAYAISPSRSDLFDLVNQHNRLSREPLRLQLGYDPTHQTAYGRVGLAF